jgi:hypothetical protein
MAPHGVTAAENVGCTYAPRFPKSEKKNLMAPRFDHGRGSSVPGCFCMHQAEAVRDARNTLTVLLQTGYRAQERQIAELLKRNWVRSAMSSSSAPFP